MYECRTDNGSFFGAFQTAEAAEKAAEQANKEQKYGEDTWQAAEKE
jgi:hypothetical protein